MYAKKYDIDYTFFTKFKQVKIVKKFLPQAGIVMV
jgi:hypothetical protein